MTMVSDTKTHLKYWDIGSYTSQRAYTFWSKSDDADNYMPNGTLLNLSGGSLCIMADKSFKWQPTEGEWVEL